MQGGYIESGALIRRPMWPPKLLRNLARYVEFKRFHDRKDICWLALLDKLASLSSCSLLERDQY